MFFLFVTRVLLRVLDIFKNPTRIIQHSNVKPENKTIKMDTDKKLHRSYRIVIKEVVI